MDPAIAYDQRIARRAALALARTPISPNMVTTAGMILGVASGWLFARGDAASSGWAGAAFIVAVWLDHVDGELARATGKTSRFGHHFDNVAMMITDVAAFVGIGLGAAARGMGEIGIVLGIAAGVAIAIIFGSRMWIENRLGHDAVRMTPVAGFEVEDILYVIGPVAWLGGLDYFVVAAGIGAPLFLVWTLWDASRALRSAAR